MLRLQTDPSFIDSHSTAQIVLILGAVAVGALVVAALAFRIRSRWLLAAALLLGVVQLFGPFGFTSVALLATCTLFPVAAWRNRDAAPAWGIFVAALAVWQTISVLWSEKLGSAGYGVIFSVALLTAFLLARDVIRRDADGLPAAIAASSPFVILSGVAVVLFRLFPNLEAAYLLSPVARLFSEPDVILISRSEVDIALDPMRWLGVFADTAEAPGSTGLLEGLFTRRDLTNFQNVLSPDKAGGVFLNGNTASMFFGVAACVSVWALTTGRLRAIHAVTAFVSIAALVATGSKTALVLAVGLPVFALFIGWACRRPIAGSIIGIVAVLAGMAGASAMLSRKPDLLTDSTLADRLGLWRMVAEAFPERWFTGFGYGYWRFHIIEHWNEYFPGVAPQVWPPHNVFLQAWTNAGIIALILVIIIMAMPLVGAVRRISEARMQPLFGPAAIARGAVLVALTWVLLHGMADTTNYAGDNHTLPFVALLTALALTRTKDRA